MTDSFKQNIKGVTCLVFDVDGVLTNGTLIVMPGELHRVMNIRDGFALKEAVLAGFKVCIISGGKSESVRKRLSDLGIEDIYLGVENKLEVLLKIISNYQLMPQQILYMGDDLPDYEVMKSGAIPCCPQDAAIEIKSISQYISPIKGGEGCARDVIEQVMRVQSKWPFSITL